jgi:glycolate oxidase FAD binding subunit
LAANVSGPRRYGFGTARDYVIGISAVNDEGEEFKAGGRVVKNVAGYDLCKLLVGSLGTLGIITQATLKLRPLPEEQALVTLACEASALETVLEKVHASRTRPVCLDCFNEPAAREVFRQANLSAPDGPWALVVGFEGNAEAVQWQVQQVVRELAGCGSLEARIGFTAGPLWQALAECSLWSGAPISFKASLLPSALASFSGQAALLAESCCLAAHAGNGIVYGHFPGERSHAEIASALAAWRQLARLSKGHVVVTRCPPAWKTALGVWDPALPEAWLMREVKNRFDPCRVFNPGRFVDGI